MFVRYGAQHYRRQPPFLPQIARDHWIRGNLLRFWNFGLRPGNNTPFRIEGTVPVLASGFTILGNVGRVLTPDGWGQDTGPGNANASGWSTTDDGYRTSITTRFTAFTLLRMTASTVSDFIFGNTDVRGGGGGVYNWGLYWGNSTSAFACYVKNTSNTVVSASNPVGSNFNQTYLVALTYDGTTVTLYVDGVAVASNAQSGNVQTTDLDTTWSEWGNQAGATNRQTVFYSGIANRVWEPEQIADLNRNRWGWVRRQGSPRLISLSTSAGATASGATITATASLIAGSASGQVAATASGTTLTATSSLIAGTATGQIAATAAGATVTATASLIAGTASGEVAATAGGATITATASLIAGTATGSSAGTAAGATVTATASLVAGSASGQIAATANGSTITATASLIPGSASGAAAGTANGATITATASLVPGAATGQINATAPGATLTATSSMVAGTATGGSASTAAGATLTATASMQAGTATGQVSATAPGVVIDATALFLAGAATGPTGATAEGAILNAAVTLITGAAYGPTLTPTDGFVARRRPHHYTAVFQRSKRRQAA